LNNINKKAYPQSGTEIFTEKPHDLNLWMKAMRYIYAYINKGMDPNLAFDKITEKWDNLDKLDFKNWMKYYTDGGAEAYKKAELEKTAQYFPAFLDVDDLKSSLPGNQMNFPEENEFEQPVINKKTEKQKADEQERLDKELADQQIKALIGRLNSAERLATTKGIAKALGPSFENWLRALHELKKEVQVAPFRTTKSALITDLIIRKGNQLAAFGDKTAARAIYKIAQIAPPPLDPSPEGSDKAPEPTTEPTTPEIPTEPSLTDTPSPELSAKPDISPEGNKDDAWVEEFLNGLEGLSDDKNDLDVSASDDLYVSDDLKIFAQEVPQTPITPGQDVVQNIPAPEGNKLEQALAGTTVDDVIAKLEAVSNVFKNREVPRQLAMVDIMMDQLGISSYFSELSEATAKALESNQYCSTRVEDVLARLKGSVNVPAEHAVDLAGEKPGLAEGNAVGLKNQLELEKNKEDARKKSREDLANKTEDAQIANPQAPAPEAVNTDALNAPTEVQAPTNPGVRV
jgi:hypothetical protein